MCLGIPGQIVEVTDTSNNLALVDVGGVRRVINIAFVIDEDRPPSACVGEWVLVHVGFAMSRLDEAEAQRTLALLRELGEAQAELAAIADTEPEGLERDRRATPVDPGAHDPTAWNGGGHA